MNKDVSAGPLFSYSRDSNGDSETKVLYGLVSKHKHTQTETTFGLGPWGLLFYVRVGNSSTSHNNEQTSEITIMFLFYLFYLFLSPRKKSWFCLPLLSFMRYVDNSDGQKSRPPTMWGFALMGLLGVAVSCAGKILVLSPLLLTVSVQTGCAETKREFTTCLLLYWRILLGRMNCRIFWPFFGVVHWNDQKTGGYKEYSVIWPLFRYQYSEKSERMTLHLLFPFFKLVKSPEEFALRFLPFTWIKTVNGVMSRGFVLLFYWEVNDEKQTIGVFPIFHMKKDKKTDTIKTLYALFMGMYRTTDTSKTLMITPLWWSHWKLSSTHASGYDYYVHMLLPLFAYGNFTPTSEQKEGAAKYFENFMLCVPLLATLVSYRPRDSIINIFVLALAWYYHDLKNERKYIYGTIYGQYQRGPARYHSVLFVLALWKEGMIMNDLDVWVLFGLIRYRYDGLVKETVTWFLPFYYVKHDERVQLPNGDYDCMNFTVRILILFKIEAHNSDSLPPPPSSTFQVDSQKEVSPVDNAYSYNYAPPSANQPPPFNPPPSNQSYNVPFNAPPQPTYAQQPYVQQPYAQQPYVQPQPYRSLPPTPKHLAANSQPVEHNPYTLQGYGQSGF